MAPSKVWEIRVVVGQVLGRDIVNDVLPADEAADTIGTDDRPRLPVPPREA